MALWIGKTAKQAILWDTKSKTGVLGFNDNLSKETRKCFEIKIASDIFSPQMLTLRGNKLGLR